MSAKSATTKSTARKTARTASKSQPKTVAKAAKPAVRAAATTAATRTSSRRSNNPSKLFASSAKNQAGPLTSEAIASDLAAFKKAGGRIEVLGNTPFRTTSTAFRSAGNTARTAPAKTAVAKTRS